LVSCDENAHRKQKSHCTIHPTNTITPMPLLALPINSRCGKVLELLKTKEASINEARCHCYHHILPEYDHDEIPYDRIKTEFALWHGTR
jgi:hypothetical protein